MFVISPVSYASYGIFINPAGRTRKWGGGRAPHTAVVTSFLVLLSLGASVNINIVDYRFYHYVMAVIFTEHLLQTIICATGNRQLSLYCYYSKQLS